MTEYSLEIVIYWNEFIDIRPWFLHLASNAIFRRKRTVLTSEIRRADRQSFCPTIIQPSKIQGYKFSCAKIKTQPKVTPLNSLYPVGSSESYFFPPTNFHTPTPHPSSSSWLFFRASFGREERTGGERVEIEMKGGREKLHLQKKDKKWGMEGIEVAAILRFTLPTSTLDLKLMAEKKLESILLYPYCARRLGHFWPAFQELISIKVIGQMSEEQD